MDIHFASHLALEPVPIALFVFRVVDLDLGGLVNEKATIGLAVRVLNNDLEMVGGEVAHLDLEVALCVGPGGIPDLIDIQVAVRRDSLDA